jgi:uncharacterized protein (TIGR00730 family)
MNLAERLLEQVSADTALSSERRDLLRDLLVRVLAVAESDANTKDLKVAVHAIDELLEAFVLFDRFAGRSKLTVFGSARTKPGTPLYELAVDLARAMADRGWIIVSGGGPGIMEAAARGGGLESTIGVNIDLPFEQSPNAFIDVSTMLVTMRYFFTRKVALTRSSIAFAILPGGIGTMDELFEIITLLDTGKTTPAPVVLLDTPDGSYWDAWTAFMNDTLIAGGYVSSLDMNLVRRARSVDDAVEQIERFYANYKGFFIEGERAYVRLARLPTPTQLDALRAVAPQFDLGEGFRTEGADNLVFDFDGRSYVPLRSVIDEVNSWVV